MAAGPVSVLTCANCGTKNSITPSERGAPHCGKCGEPLPWLVNADAATFEVETRAAPTVVVDLWAPWCGPCRIVGPILEELAREYAGRLKVVKVNVDENQGLAVRYEAMSIPTMVVMREDRSWIGSSAHSRSRRSAPGSRPISSRRRAPRPLRRVAPASSRVLSGSCPPPRRPPWSSTSAACSSTGTRATSIGSCSMTRRRWNRFLADVVTPEWNGQQDSGRTWAEAVEVLTREHPEQRDLIAAYWHRWQETLGDAIAPTVEILEELRANRRPAVRAEQLVGRDVPRRPPALPIPRVVRRDRHLRRGEGREAGPADLPAAARSLRPRPGRDGLHRRLGGERRGGGGAGPGRAPVRGCGNAARRPRPARAARLAGRRGLRRRLRIVVARSPADPPALRSASGR